MNFRANKVLEYLAETTHLTGQEAEDLKKKLEMVLGIGTTMAPGKKADEIDLDEQVQSSPASKLSVVQNKPAVKAPTKEVDFDNDDESLSYFAKLAED